MASFNRVRILPYKQGSRSAKALADALEVKRLRVENSRFTPRLSDTIINWGSSSALHAAKFSGFNILNSPSLIRAASNKALFFDLCKDKDWLPPFWSHSDEIPDEAFPVLCRTILNGHSGAGIVLADCRDDLVDAPLYVKYIPKKDEYRVHVGRRNRTAGDGDEQSIIAVQRKARRLDVPSEEVNWKVRNASNGFVFVRQNVNPPKCVIDVAKEAVSVVGLAFGAVDVIYNEKQGKAYVLEINTAPGLEGQTVLDYADFFRKEYL